LSASLVKNNSSQPLGLSANEVVIVSYNEGWPALYEQERNILHQALVALQPSFEHIGSTAVPGFNAKPIIDIMAGVSDPAMTADACHLLQLLGYTAHGEKGITGRLFFTKGLPSTHHLHLVPIGGDFWKEHIIFRDELITNPDAAARYLGIKLTLAEHYARNRQKYTDGKAAVIEDILAAAKQRLEMKTK